MNPYKKKSVPKHKTITLLGKVVMRDNELTVELLAPHLRRHFLKTYCKVGDHMSITLVNKNRYELQHKITSIICIYRLYLSHQATQWQNSKTGSEKRYSQKACEKFMVKL